MKGRTLDPLRQLNCLLKGWRARWIAVMDRLLNYKYTKNRFQNNVGYDLNLTSPRSFNEKVIWKKIHDRNPLLPITADKHRVRSYVKDTLGQNRAKDVLIPQLYVTDEPETIPFHKLPDNYIVKANHGSGWNIIVREQDISENYIVSRCKSWLKRPYRLREHEWAYQSIDRKIVIEKLMKNDQGKIPKDFKIYMIHGQCRLITKVAKRFNEGPSAVSFLDSDFNLLPVSRPHLREGRELKKPDNYRDMMNIATKLAEPFDMVRVDLYSIEGHIYFGELTHYPLGGQGRFEPEAFDFELGKDWELEQGYWRRQ